VGALQGVEDATFPCGLPQELTLHKTEYKIDAVGFMWQKKSDKCIHQNLKSHPTSWALKQEVKTKGANKTLPR